MYIHCSILESGSLNRSERLILGFRTSNFATRGVNTHLIYCFPLSGVFVQKRSATVVFYSHEGASNFSH